MKLATAYLLLIFILLSYGSYNRQFRDTKDVPLKETPRVYAQEKKETKDERPSRLEEFFERYNSPLKESASDFIKASDKYDLDWRLLPAISGVESTFETLGNTSDHNPFGYMCPGKPCHFSSFEESIYRVAKTIGESSAYKRYRETGQIYDLAEKYNYVSPEEWTSKVNFFMIKI